MEEGEKTEEILGHVAKVLTAEEVEKMRAQDSRLVSEFQANQIERDVKKNWDLFYKRNETRFFKDRHWTTREFAELLQLDKGQQNVLLEIGCGVGNLIYPLLEDGAVFEKIFACDLSPRAVEFVESHKLYNPDKIVAFQTDVTTESCFSEISIPVNITTMIFVLSAIHPSKFKCVLDNLCNITAKGGTVLFRDYGLYDMAQLRFKAGHKIAENLYVRQDGTRSYYFSVDEVKNLFHQSGFETITCDYVQRRTINVKENINVPRVFVQGKFVKR